MGAGSSQNVGLGHARPSGGSVAPAGNEASTGSRFSQVAAALRQGVFHSDMWAVLGLSGHQNPNPEEIKSFFELMQMYDLKLDMVKQALNRCPKLVSVRNLGTNGETPLHCLLTCNTFCLPTTKLLDVITMLVEHGAPLDVKDQSGSTPLSLLFENSPNHWQLLQIAALLIQHGPYPDQVLLRKITAKIRPALRKQPPRDANLLAQHQNPQDQALACQQALALCPYGYLQTVIGLDALKEHIDTCTPENIHEPAPGSVYPPLWHAVARGDVDALTAVVDKMGGLDFRVCLPESSMTLDQFLGHLASNQILEPKHAVVQALFCHLYNVETLVLENYLNPSRYQGKDGPHYESHARCLKLFHAVVKADMEAVEEMGAFDLVETCLPGTNINLAEFFVICEQDANAKSQVGNIIQQLNGLTFG